MFSNSLFCTDNKDVHIPFLHSTAAFPTVPGGHRHTNTTCSLIHSAPLPHPSVRQSMIARSEIPRIYTPRPDNHIKYNTIHYHLKYIPKQILTFKPLYAAYTYIHRVDHQQGSLLDSNTVVLCSQFCTQHVAHTFYFCTSLLAVHHIYTLGTGHQYILEHNYTQIHQEYLCI